MVYIEHDTAEPLIEQHASGSLSQRWPTQRTRQHSRFARSFVIGAITAGVVYIGIVIVGWQGVSGILHSISL